MKNTHMSCPISPQGHCRRGEKNEANFPTCIFRARLLVNRAAVEGEGNQGQNKLRFYFESRQVCTFDFALEPFGLAKGTGTKVMSSF